MNRSLAAASDVQFNQLNRRTRPVFFIHTGLDIFCRGAIIRTTSENFKPMMERSNQCRKPSESPGWCDRGGGRSVNGLRRADQKAKAE